jgi:hypothetical protein
MARGSLQPQVRAGGAEVIRAAEAHRGVMRCLAEASVAFTGEALTYHASHDACRPNVRHRKTCIL